MRPPIPLPDAEAIARYTLVRVLSPSDPLSNCRCSLRARALRWALNADTAGLDLLMLSWPDRNFCFAAVPRNSLNMPAALAPPAILTAYRHALRDPHAHRVLYPLGEHLQLLSEGK